MPTAVVSPEIVADAVAGESRAVLAVLDAYEPMMKAEIRKAAPTASPDDVDDLLQEARVALLERLRDYDTTHVSAANLYTYAHHSVRRAIRKQWVRIATDAAIDVDAVLRVRGALFRTDGDFAKAYQKVNEGRSDGRRMSYGTFMEVLSALAEKNSFDAQCAGTEYTLAETIPDTRVDAMGTVDRRALLTWLMNEIPPRQSLAVRAFYGFGMQQEERSATAVAMGVKVAALDVLRSRGISNARKVATAHGISA
ncbi:sigma factor [Streptomyces varsoviensis]|uniref:sigma factor n=1 Tax=Streptomyces varsoviensis TaxID=67373 RepID=UPI0033D3F7B0